MTSLSGLLPAATYNQILQIGSGNSGVTGSLQTVQDGSGSNTCLGLASNLFSINGHAVSLLGDLTFGGAFTTSGSYGLTFTLNGTTSLTLPTSGTLITTTGVGAGGTWSISITGSCAGNAATSTLANTVTTNANMSGDVTSVGNVTTCVKINGQALGSTTPNSGAVLIGSGSDWVTKAISGDVTLANTGAVSVTALKGVSLGTVTATSGNVLIGSGSTWTTQSLSGAISMTSAGVTSFASVAAHKLLANTTSSSAAPIAVSTSNFIQQVNTQIFTASGTYTPTTGMVYCYGIVLGGGGAGGGGDSIAGANYGWGGGGGAGGIAEGLMTAVDIGASKAVTIGAGGASAVGTTGGSGGNSSLGTLLVGSGGAGGGGGTNTTVPILGGVGGSGSGTKMDVSTKGGYGGLGTLLNYVGGFLACGGKGADSRYGGGGPEALTNAQGINATVYGAGGGGGATNGAGGSSNSGGGTGSAGLVIIIEYIAV